MSTEEAKKHLTTMYIAYELKADAFDKDGEELSVAIEALEKLNELRCKYCEKSCEPIIEKVNQRIYCVCVNEMFKEEVSE